MKIEEFYIKDISLTNYKKYTSLEHPLCFHKQFTLIIGENGAGKTSILDAVATILGGYLQVYKNIKSGERHSIKFSDINVKTLEIQGIQTLHYKTPVEVKGICKINNNDVPITRFRQSTNPTAMTKLLKKDNHALFRVVSELEDNVDSILPVISYHGTGRLWEQNKTASKMEHLTKLDGYKDCLNAKSNYRNFLAWFEKLERHEFNIRQEIPVLKAVKNSVMQAISMLTERDVESFNYREADLEIKFIDSTQRERVSLMSDGYKNIIGIVSDIAYRMAILNPSLGKEITNKTTGIILIDEIDLHLHPKWQKEIINILITLFPRVQFIASSHSPFIIQSLSKGSLIKLDDSTQARKEDPTKMSIEDISEFIQEIEMPQLSSKKIEMLEAANEYFLILTQFKEKKIDKKEVQKMKDKLDSISKRYDDNMAYVAFLESKRRLTQL